MQAPMAVNDEISHFSRAYEVSRGTLLTERRADGNLGGTVPYTAAAFDAMYNFAPGSKPTPLQLRTSIASLGKNSIDEPHKQLQGYSNTAQYAPTAYLPQAIAIGFARLVNMTVLHTIYLVRLTVLACFIALTAMAIRIMPNKKWLLAVIGLLPMTMQEAASMSQDALLIGCCLLFIACFCYVYKTKKLAINMWRRTIPLWPLIMLATVYVSLAKFVYFPLFLILLFIPVKTFGSAQRRIKLLTLWLAIPFVLLTVWNGLTAKQGVSEGQRLAVNSVGIYPPATATEGIKSLLHPKYTAKLLFHTYIDQAENKQVIPDYITESFFGKFTSFFIPTPSWYIVTVATTLLFGFFIVDQDALVFSRRIKLTMLGAFVIAIAGITFSMYFYTTTAGADFINGVQGRYFLPLIGFLIFFCNWPSFIVIVNRLRSRAILTGLLIGNLAFMQIILYQWFWKI
jgi:uncharacterized membrane protein